eukprot:10951-Heterococcus_DN1.PRE.2
MGVRSGGCSGLSYVMDLVEESAVMEEDMIEEYPEELAAAVCLGLELVAATAHWQLDCSVSACLGQLAAANPCASAAAPTATVTLLLLHSQYGFKCAIDPKSVLYLYGLQLDYSDALIGGGFQFQNPNAESACGCGKSFGV